MEDYGLNKFEEIQNLLLFKKIFTLVSFSSAG